MKRCAVGFLALIGCSGGGDGSLRSPRVIWDSPGTGATNVLPLDPMRIGTRASGAALEVRWASVVHGGGHDLGVLEVVTPGLDDTDVAFFQKTADGVVLHAIDRHVDATTRPILMVPNTVRVGMEWRSVLDDGTVSHQTVVGRADVVLALGPATVWAIAEDDGLGAYGKVRWYGEGIGRVAETTTATWDPALAYAEFVVPDADQPAAELALAPAPIAPLADGTGQPFDVSEASPFDISGANTNAATWLYLPTSGAIGTGAAGRCIRLDAVPAVFGPGDVPECPSTPAGGCQSVAPGAYTCSFFADVTRDAAELVPGTHRLDYRSFVGQSRAFGYASGLSVDFVANELAAAGYPEAGATSASDVAILATWAAPDGVHCLGASTGGLQLFHGNDLCLGTAAADVVDAIGAMSVYRRGNADPTTLRVFGPTQRPDATSAFTLGGIDRDGRVYRFTVAGDHVGAFAPAGILPGRSRTFVDADERMAYAITVDGRAFRARVIGDQVVLESLGDVAEAGTTGWTRPRALVPDPSHAGHYVLALETPTSNGLYRATLDRAPVSFVSPATLQVAERLVDGGVAVCWPPSAQAFDPTGWSVGGKPAAMVVGPTNAAGTCAVLVPDPTPDPSYVGAERAVAGSLPGMGRVRLGVPATATLAPTDPAATVLRDGTVVTLAGTTLDELGLPRGRVPVPGVAPYAQRDLAGYGWWVTYGAKVANVGGGLAVPADCTGAGCTVLGPAIGGGVLWSTGELSTPSGVVAIPAPQWTALTGLGGELVVLADGRVCGFVTNGTVVRCIDASGAATNATSPPTFHITSDARKDTYWPLPGGDLLVIDTSPDSPSWRFDPVAMTVTQLDPRGLHEPMTASNGDVYAFAESAPGNIIVQLVRITATGLVDVGAPMDTYAGASGSFGPNRWTILPLADQLLVHAGGTVAHPQPWWFRLPRPL